MTQRKQGTRRKAAAAAERLLPEGPSVTHRQLVARGLAPGEAANLIAYLNRLSLGEQPWTLREVNTLLFLRTLERAGRFGPNDGVPTENDGVPTEEAA